MVESSRVRILMWPIIPPPSPSSIRLRPISHIQPNLVSIDVFLDGQTDGRLHIWARAKSAEKLRQHAGSSDGRQGEGTIDEQASTQILVKSTKWQNTSHQSPACLGRRAEGRMAGTPLELSENSLQNLLYEALCHIVHKYGQRDQQPVPYKPS